MKRNCTARSACATRRKARERHEVYKGLKVRIPKHSGFCNHFQTIISASSHCSLILDAILYDVASNEVMSLGMSFEREVPAESE